MASRTHVAAARKFIKAATWLTDEDEPAVTTLLALAKVLDTSEPQAALFSQHGLVYRSLLKRKPSGDGSPTDSLEALLSGGDGAE